MILYLFKSACLIKNLGSCRIKLLRSFSLMELCGGNYWEQIFIVLCTVALATIAFRLVFRLISL